MSRARRPGNRNRVWRLAMLAVVVAWLASPSPAIAQTGSSVAGLRQWLDYLEPRTSLDALDERPDLNVEMQRAVQAIEAWATRLAAFSEPRSFDTALVTLRDLLEAKRRIDRWTDQAFELRGEVAQRHESAADRDRLRRYLRAVSSLIDLSGRLRYLQFDALNAFAARWARTPQERAALIDVLTEYRSSVGASVAIASLMSAPVPQPATPRNRATGQASAEDAQLAKVLKLVVAAADSARLADLVALLDHVAASPQRTVAVAEAIVALGLPQPPRPDTPADLPKPVITPQQLQSRLAKIDRPSLAPDWRSRYDEVMKLVQQRATKGLAEPRYHLGSYDLQPGDWLLMRNPSPYNLFTDLAPGLFTHVGVVALETGTDGITRLVIVDLPERGSKMPATNVEIFLQRTLHYVFLRHVDESIAARMGVAAADVIDNDIEFDLNFRTTRVTELAGQPLKGKKIHTYCAGLLLLCALQTPSPRSEFFPVREGAAPGMTAENLATLGMSIGDDFISPTGAFFSSKLRVVGRCEPAYDPNREIEEAIFDYFADRLAEAKLNPTLSLFDTLRLKVAEASRHNPLLSQALAQAAGVSANIDLVSAAKAAAVVETLDEVAFGQSDEFQAARNAIRNGPAAAPRSGNQANAGVNYRGRHADLVARFERGELSPRQLRIELVTYYIAAGKKRIDELYFNPEKKSGKS